MMSKTTNKFSLEVRARAVRMVLDHGGECSISEKTGCVPQSLHKWVKRAKIVRVFAENFGVYGVRKVWRQMRREGFNIARCTVERLMRDLGLRGVIRGRPVRTTVSDKAAPCPLDHVNRQFHAPVPNRLWMSDITYVAKWAGFVYAAFVINVYTRYIVSLRASRTAHASFVLDALKQAIHEPGLSIVAASSTIATAEANISRSSTSNASPKQR